MDLQPIIEEAYALLQSGADEALPIAQAMCQRALDQDPPNVNARVILARIAQRNFQYALAIKYLTEAVERNPVPTIIRELAQVWFSIGRHDKALELFSGLTALEGASAEDKRIVSELSRRQQTTAVDAQVDAIVEGETDLIEWSETLVGPDDIELEIPRVSPLTYHCTAPRSGPAQGLVVLIAGFGEDATTDYQRKLRAHIAEHYHLAVVSVEHHCVSNRLSTGAEIKIPPANMVRIRALCAAYGTEFLPKDIEKSIADLGAQLPDLAIGGVLAPKNGDYQNFGVLQAMDFLPVLGRLFLHGKLDIWLRNIVLFGSGHGGYIAHLVAKFAPNSISAIVSNSGYLGVGVGTRRFISGEANPAQIHFNEGVEIITKVENLRATLLLNTITPWNAGSTVNGRLFDEGHREIRDLTKHMNARRRASLCPVQYRMIHSSRDTMESCAAWRAYAQILDENRNNVEFIEVTDQDVDDQFIKTLDHGLGVSLRELFDHFYPGLQPRISSMTDFDLKTTISFDCAPFRKYTIQFHPGKAELSIQS